MYSQDLGLGLRNQEKAETNEKQKQKQLSLSELLAERALPRLAAWFVGRQSFAMEPQADLKLLTIILLQS